MISVGRYFELSSTNGSLLLYESYIYMGHCFCIYESYILMGLIFIRVLYSYGSYIHMGHYSEYVVHVIAIQY